MPTAESQYLRYISRMWVLGLALVRKWPKVLHSMPRNVDEIHTVRVAVHQQTAFA